MDLCLPQKHQCREDTRLTTLSRFSRLRLRRKDSPLISVLSEATAHHQSPSLTRACRPRIKHRALLVPSVRAEFSSRSGNAIFSRDPWVEGAARGLPALGHTRAVQALPVWEEDPARSPSRKKRKMTKTTMLRRSTTSPPWYRVLGSVLRSISLRREKSLLRRNPQPRTFYHIRRKLPLGLWLGPHWTTRNMSALPPSRLDQKTPFPHGIHESRSASFTCLYSPENSQSRSLLGFRESHWRGRSQSSPRPFTLLYQFLSVLCTGTDVYFIPPQEGHAGVVLYQDTFRITR